MAAVGGKKTNTKANIATWRRVTAADHSRAQHCLFAPPSAAGAGGGSGAKAPAGGAAPDEGLWPSDLLLAGRVKFPIDAAAEHGGIRVVDNGGWEDSLKLNPVWLHKPRRQQEENEAAHHAIFVPSRLGAEWSKRFRAGAVAVAVGKEVVTICFMIEQMMDAGIPSWQWRAVAWRSIRGAWVRGAAAGLIGSRHIRHRRVRFWRDCCRIHGR